MRRACQGGCLRDRTLDRPGGKGSLFPRVVFDFLRKKLKESLPKARKVVPGSREDYEERRQWAENLRAQGRRDAAWNLLTELEKDLRAAGSFPLAVAVRHRLDEWRDAPVAEVGGEPAAPGAPVPVGSPPEALGGGVTPTGLYRAVRAAATLEELPAEEVTALVEASGLTRFPAGTVVLEEGSEGDALYVVTRGELEVRTKGAAGEPVRLGTLEVGDFFGEIALLTGRPRAATVAARSDAECLRITRDTWRVLAARHPLLVRRLQREIEVRARLAAEAVVDDLRRRRGEPPA